MPVDPKDDPSTPSADWKAMSWAWKMIRDILDGGKCIREAKETYLPRFQNESNTSYEGRLKAAPWRPEFADALRSLCSRPFTKEVVVNEGAPEEFIGKVVDEETKKREGGLVDDIDGLGNSLHVFARETFVNAVAYGLDAIYVTFPADNPAKTKADEKAVGARPYWVHIRAECILSLLTKLVAGRTIVSEIRIKECETIPDGYAESEVERIRILKLDAADQPTWQTFVKDAKGDFQPEAAPQVLEVKGAPLKEIPVALLFTGERSGNYRVKMPLVDLADVQLELYRAGSNKEQILLKCGSPMLVMQGMRPPEPSRQILSDGREVDLPASQQEVGPGTIIYAYSDRDGVQPDAKYISADAGSITEVRNDINDIMDDFRRLALQPNTPKSGNLVATGQAIDAAKSHSAVQVWANALADALNQALAYTAEWMGVDDTVTVSVHTDFGIELQGVEEARYRGEMQGRKVISAKTEREEAARQGILGPEFDEEEEDQRLAEEAANNTMVPEQTIDPVTGKPVAMPGAIDPVTGLPVPPKKGPGVPPPKPGAGKVPPAPPAKGGKRFGK